MPARRPERPAVREQLVPTAIGGDAASIDRAVSAAGEAARRAELAAKTRSIIAIDLVVGANVIAHNLGRKPRAASVTPTVADATFAWALTAADDKHATITVVGVAQPGAAVEVSA